MAELLLVLAAIAAALLAFVAWLHSVGLASGIPAWCGPTALLILTILTLIGFGRAWRTRP